MQSPAGGVDVQAHCRLSAPLDKLSINAGSAIVIAIPGCRYDKRGTYAVERQAYDRSVTRFQRDLQLSVEKSGFSSIFYLLT